MMLLDRIAKFTAWNGSKPFNQEDTNTSGATNCWNDLEIPGTNVMKQERIVTKPDVMLGKPVFRGTRIPIYVVLDLIDAGVDQREILLDYPPLTAEDIAAAIEFRRDTERNVTVRAL